MAASPRRRRMRRQARTPGRPRSARHRAPGRRAADRRGCVGGAGGLAQARSPARAAAAARNALSLATTKQPRTQVASGKIETWRSRASALLQVKQRRETLCRWRRQNNPARKMPAARSRRGGRAQARSYGRCSGTRRLVDWRDNTTPHTKPIGKPQPQPSRASAPLRTMRQRPQTTRARARPGAPEIVQKQCPRRPRRHAARPRARPPAKPATLCG